MGQAGGGYYGKGWTNLADHVSSASTFRCMNKGRKEGRKEGKEEDISYFQS